MSQMVRKQIYIEKRQDRLLKKQARLRKTSEAELIREGIDSVTQGYAMPRLFRRDPDAWEKLERFIRARRARATTTAQPYRWKRGDAYADRMNRYASKTK